MAKRQKRDMTAFIPQDQIEAEMKAMLPALASFQIPNLEAILNASPFNTYRVDLLKQGKDPLSQYPPAFDMHEQRPTVEMVLGLQLGSKGCKYEPPQLIQEGIGKEFHLSKSCALAAHGNFP